MTEEQQRTEPPNRRTAAGWVWFAMLFLPRILLRSATAILAVIFSSSSPSLSYRRYGFHRGTSPTASRPRVSLGAHANGRRGTARSAAYSFKGLSQIIKLVAELGTLRVREGNGEPTRCFDSWRIWHQEEKLECARSLEPQRL
jgi:hypothetical protein